MVIQSLRLHSSEMELRRAMDSVFETQRLLLRHFTLADISDMDKINSCPQVMQFFPTVYTFDDQTCQAIQAVIKRYRHNEHAIHACLLKDTQQRIGSVGITYQDFKAFFTPCYEIGWRLHHRFWGKGYAVEAARAIIEDAFTYKGLEEMVSYAPAQHNRSIRVMKKLGFQSNREYFKHTLWDVTHPSSRHVLYRLTKKHDQVRSAGCVL